jgi:hypothetical protein
MGFICFRNFGDIPAKVRKTPRNRRHGAGRVGPDGRKVGHSFYKGVAESYQSVIAYPTNSDEAFLKILVALTPI